MRVRLAGLLAIFAVLFAASCQSQSEHASASQARPNIVFLLVEDLSPRIGAFGDALARTPNLDQMAREGVRYTSVYTAAGVCAPSRAAMITGMHQASIGAQHMRTSAYRWPDGRLGYEAVPPAFVKAFPEVLRAAGYYTTNNSKTDYQFGNPFTVWDENGADAHWKNRPAGAPFFAMYSLQYTHESALFLPDAASGLDPASANAAKAMEARRATLALRTRPEDVVVPPYYPDTSTVRADIARQYDNVQLMDAWVGERIEELRREGVLDNTIVIWATDHGDGLPRGKRSLYDSGLHVPMIVRFPDGRMAGQADDRMISFVDLAPTILALAQVKKPPGHLQGVDAFSAAGQKQDRVFAERDRLDEWMDLSRAIRTRDFKYIRNEYPDAPFYLKLAYRENVPMMAEMRRLFEAGKLSPLQASYFRTPRPAEELYDLRADPDEVRNLAGDPAFAAKRAELSSVLAAWRKQIGDPGKQPEDAMVKAAWGGDKQPATAKPSIQAAPANGQFSVALSDDTPGASIGYRLAGETRWKLYVAPFAARAGQRIEAKAVRYGFKESDVQTEAVGD